MSAPGHPADEGPDPDPQDGGDTGNQQSDEGYTLSPYCSLCGKAREVTEGHISVSDGTDDHGRLMWAHRLCMEGHDAMFMKAIDQNGAEPYFESIRSMQADKDRSDESEDEENPDSDEGDRGREP